MEQILDFRLESLATIVGIALIVKYVLVPISKELWPDINGRWTTLVAVGAGIALSLGYRVLTGWALPGAEWLEAGLFGLIGGWAAVGLQDLTSAALRPHKL